MKYPEQSDNYDVDIFNENFLELSIGQMQAAKDLENEESRASSRENIIESNFNAEAQAIRQLIDTAYASANGYTDTKIAQLINGAPSTLDTLKEIADALESNETVVDALNSAIGTKANQTELDLHTGNSTIHVTAAEKENWNTPTFSQASTRENINTKESLPTLFGKIKKWFSDLETVAFTGKYTDLLGTPTSLPANGGNSDTVDGIHIQVVSALPSDAASHPDTLYIVTG